jgi:hypothetical protein
MSDPKNDKPVRLNNNEPSNPLHFPASSITRTLGQLYSGVDNTVYELNLRGRMEKLTARTRIEADDNSPYKWLL